MSPGASLESLDNESGISMGERGHFEFELGIAESTGNGGKLRGHGSAIDLCGDDRAIGGFACLVANDDLQKRALSSEPGPGIDELQLESRGRRDGRRSGRRGSGSRGRSRRSNRLLIWRQRNRKRSRLNLFDDGVVLFIDAQPQGLFAIGIQRQQVKIVVGAPVQDAATEINCRINQCVSGPTIFRLYVIGGVACFHVGIVTEEHLRICSDLPRTEPAPQESFRRI
jgi:hypothetical protein